MAIDRAATIKRAESLLGEGKLDAAILEYVRLIDEQPSDWSAGNMLGDLYVRAGDKDKATALFTQIADSQYEQGFVAKATAFYKKALKVKSGHEQSLLRLAEIAAKQELMADARLYLGQLLQRRRDRGDDVGVADCVKRLAALGSKDEAPPAEPPPPEPAAPLELPVLSAVSESAERPAQPEPSAVAEAAVLVEPVVLAEPQAPAEPPEPSEPPEQLIEVPLRPSIEAVDLMALLDEMPQRDAPVDAVVPLVEVVVAPAVSVSSLPTVSSVPRVPNVSTHGNVASAVNVPNDSNVRAASADMKARFEEMLARSRQARPPVDVPGDQQAHEGAGEAGGDVVAQLEAAALTPSLEFQASAQLGRVLIERGELQAGIQWLERAALAPIQVPEHAMAVLYEMADALERMGDTSRALAVLTDIESDVGSYRDVRERIDRLTRAQAGGRGA